MAKHRVLVVDDQHDVRRMLCHALNDLDPDLDVADVPSGEEARFMISRRPVDLLVLDVYLPGMSGLELQQWARLRNPHTKVIFITGMADPEIRRQVASSGVEAIFFKPIDIREFVDAVRRCLNLKGTSPMQQAGPALTSPERAPRLESSAKTSAPTSRPSVATLRSALQASALLLLDMNGQIVTQDGTLPEGIDWVGWSASIVKAAEAGRQVSQLVVSDGVDYFLYVKGESNCLALIPGGEGRSLLTVTSPTVDKDWLLQELHSRRSEITGLTNMVIEDQGQPEAPAEAAESLPELDDIFTPSSEQPLSRENLDAFWESAVDESQPGKEVDPNVITYEQARKLGLAPDVE